jgi:hypothetical protein
LVWAGTAGRFNGAGNVNLDNLLTLKLTLITFDRLAGLPDFSWYDTPNRKKYTKSILNISNIYTNNFHSKAIQNIFKLGFFSMKINHMATLLPGYIQLGKEN